MRIQLTSKSGVTTKEGKFGKTFQEIDIEFQDLDDGRAKKKHLVSFNFKDFPKIVEAGIGSSWQITTKPAKDPQYVDWVDATPLPTPAPAGMVVAYHGERATPATPAYKSTYETPEERAKKQVYIVRQSSITAALAFFEGKTNSVAQVLDVAKQFEAHVFGQEQAQIPTVE